MIRRTKRSGSFWLCLLLNMILNLEWTIPACIFSFFGCRNKHIQDGPGMINDLNWKAFTLSRSDSYAQYNFSFTVEKSGSDYLLTGDCRDLCRSL